jgi:hypothetical protein
VRLVHTFVNKKNKINSFKVASKQNPFVMFTLGETKKRTRTEVGGGEHPIWKQQVRENKEFKRY